MSTRPTTDTPVIVNGEPFPLAAPTDVVSLVTRLLPEFVADGAPRGVAVALNDVVLPRGAWETTLLAAGDRVEVVTAVQGG